VPAKLLSDRAQGDLELEPGFRGDAGGPRSVRQHQRQEPTPHTWPLQHAAVYTVLWSVAPVAVFVPLSVRQYKRAAAR
jgi:hypothetical protein